MSTKLVVVIALATLVACGADGASSTTNRDPRCVSACKVDPPAIVGAGEVCDMPSLVQCLDECEARIAGTTTVCGNCLVEEACLGPSCDPVGPGLDCDAAMCWTYGPKGMCSYPVNNEAAYEDCRRQVDPRATTACTAKFRATSDCASLCTP